MTTPDDGSADELGDTESTPDLPDDPRWCVDQREATERVPTTEADNECAAELTAESCEANPACTAVFGRGIECAASGACIDGAVEFLGCVPFTICKMGSAIYCRSMQGFLVTYASMQGDCTPFWMSECLTTPDLGGEQPPECD